MLAWASPVPYRIVFKVPSKYYLRNTGLAVIPEIPVSLEYNEVTKILLVLGRPEADPFRSDANAHHVGVFSVFFVYGSVLGRICSASFVVCCRLRRLRPRM